MNHRHRPKFGLAPTPRRLLIAGKLTGRRHVPRCAACRLPVSPETGWCGACETNYPTEETRQWDTAN